MITWKTIVFWYWLRDLQSFFFFSFSRTDVPRGLVMEKAACFDCKLKKTHTHTHKYREDIQKVETSFSGPSVYSHFKVAYYWLHLCFPTAENSTDKELFKTYLGNVQLYLASVLPGFSMNAEVFILEMDSENLIGPERGRWRSAPASSAQCLRLSLALKTTQRKQ